MPAVNYSLLRDFRDDFDLSNGELAELVFLSPDYVSNIVNGHDKPSMRAIRRFARLFGISIDQIRDTSLSIDQIRDTAAVTGDPSDPPQQPKNEPKGPPRRQDTEQDRKGPSPKRSTAEAAA